MARLRVEGSDLLVSLSLLERIGALHADLRVPLASVADVAASDCPWGLLRGIRAPGTGLPGVIALGTWRYRGGRDFAALYRRLPAVVVTIAGGPFTRLLISSPDAEAVATRLRAATRRRRRRRGAA
jgi:hypothetical protein